MAKTLTRTGEGLAIVLDEATLAAAGIDADTPVEVSAEGDMIVIARAGSPNRAEKLKRILDRLDREHAAAFRRLAE